MDTGICLANNNNQLISYQQQRRQNRPRLPPAAGKPSKSTCAQGPAQKIAIKCSWVQIRLEDRRPCHPARSLFKAAFIARAAANPAPLIKVASWIHANKSSAITRQEQRREQTSSYPTQALQLYTSGPGSHYIRLERTGSHSEWLINVTVISTSIVDYNDTRECHHYIIKITSFISVKASQGCNQSERHHRHLEKLLILPLLEQRIKRAIIPIEDDCVCFKQWIKDYYWSTSHYFAKMNNETVLSWRVRALHH